MNSFIRWAILATIISSATPFRLRSLVEDTTDDRIYNGVNATIGQFPYQASIRYRAQFGDIYHICGGTIIDKHWILTHSRCSKGPWNQFVYVGTISGDSGIEYVIEQFVLHPRGNHATGSSAIAVARTKTPIQFSETVKPIPLSKQFVEAGVKSIGSGWGSNVRIRRNR